MGYTIPKDMILFLSLFEKWMNQKEIIYSYRQEKPKIKHIFRYTFEEGYFVIITPDSVRDDKESLNTSEETEKMEWLQNRIIKYRTQQKTTTIE